MNSSLLHHIELPGCTHSSRLSQLRAISRTFWSSFSCYWSVM